MEKTMKEPEEIIGFETLVISKLISIESRLTAMESSVTWFKFIARGTALVVFGFFGLDLSGAI